MKNGNGPDRHREAWKGSCGTIICRRNIGSFRTEVKAVRLDKYLKVSRLIKRRTVANEACDAGRVLVNDRPVKASYSVKEGDVLEIVFGNKSVKVRVLNVRETVKKEEAAELYEYI